MKFVSTVARVAVLTMMSGLAACGGGGGSTATEYPLDSAMSAYLQAKHTDTLTASSGSDHYIVLRGWTPGGMQTFQGVSAFSAIQSAVFTDNGSTLSNDVQTKFFLTGPYKPLGAIDANGSVFVEANQQKLPDLASVGDSGKFLTGKDYADASLSTVVETYVATWDLTAVTADKAMLCFEYATTVLSDRSVHNSALCYIMDQRGNVTAIQESVELNGQQLIFK